MYPSAQYFFVDSQVIAEDARLMYFLWKKQNFYVVA